MEKRKVVDKRSIRLEKVLRDDFIPFFGGRPRREKVIGSEDQTNLLIALNTSSSVEDFIKKV